MTVHGFQATCECGNVWRVDDDPDGDDRMATCIACGADTYDLTDIGEPRNAGWGST